MVELGMSVQPPGAATRIQWQYTPVDATAAPFVTVITPFFEAGRVFEQTRASLLGQSFQQWEWIIVNDASCDPVSLAILAALRDTDPRIKVLDQPERRGPAAARNLAAKAANSPYLFFLDSDDLLEPTALEKMLWCLESHPEWAACKGYTCAFEGQSYVAKVGFDQAWLFLDRDPITLTALVRRMAFSEVDGFDETMRTGLEDWDLWLRFAAQGYWGYTIPEVLDWYRRRRNHADRWRSWTDRGVKQVRRDLRRRYPALYRRGITNIPEHSFEADKSLREDAPFENSLLADRRSLLILPSIQTATEIPPESESLNGALTVVALSTQGALVPAHLAQLMSEVFILPNFLHPADYLRFLVYFINSRKFEHILLWDCPFTLDLYAFLQIHHPLSVFKRLDVNGTQTLDMIQLGSEVTPHSGEVRPVDGDLTMLQALARRVISHCAVDKQTTEREQRVSHWYERLGRLGVWFFLARERLWWWGRLIKEKLWLQANREDKCA